MGNIFITGATGFLGSYLLKLLLAKNKNRAYILVRADSRSAALKRGRALIEKLFPGKKKKKISGRYYIIPGDIRFNGLGLSHRDYNRMLRSVDTIYHCAAEREFGHSLDDIRKTNVKGTENLLKVGLDWKRRGCLDYVHHVSTAFIAGDYKGRFYEDQLDVSQRFNNTYERSKFEAELAVRKYRQKGLSVDVYRPSIIVENLHTANQNGPSPPLRLLPLFASEIFKKIPASGDSEFNMLPVDIVSKGIYLISSIKNRPLNQNYHITNPSPVRLRVLLDAASSYFGFKKPECIPASKFNMDELTTVQKKAIKAFIPYLNQGLSFDISNVFSVVKDYDLNVFHLNKEKVIKILKSYERAGAIPWRSHVVKK